MPPSSFDFCSGRMASSPHSRVPGTQRWTFQLCFSIWILQRIQQEDVLWGKLLISAICLKWFSVVAVLLFFRLMYICSVVRNHKTIKPKPLKFKNLIPFIALLLLPWRFSPSSIFFPHILSARDYRKVLSIVFIRIPGDLYGPGHRMG